MRNISHILTYEISEVKNRKVVVRQGPACSASLVFCSWGEESGVLSSPHWSFRHQISFLLLRYFSLEVKQPHPPDKHIVRCDPQAVGRFVALPAFHRGV